MPTRPYSPRSCFGESAGEGKDVPAAPLPRLLPHRPRRSSISRTGTPYVEGHPGYVDRGPTSRGCESHDDRPGPGPPGSGTTRSATGRPAHLVHSVNNPQRHAAPRRKLECAAEAAPDAARRPSPLRDEAPPTAPAELRRLLRDYTALTCNFTHCLDRLDTAGRPLQPVPCGTGTRRRRLLLSHPSCRTTGPQAHEGVSPSPFGCGWARSSRPHWRMRETKIRTIDGPTKPHQELSTCQPVEYSVILRCRGRHNVRTAESRWARQASATAVSSRSTDQPFR